MGITNTGLEEKFGQVAGGLRFHVGTVDLTEAGLSLATPLNGLYAFASNVHGVADITFQGHSLATFCSPGFIEISWNDYDATCTMAFVAIGW